MSNDNTTENINDSEPVDTGPEQPVTGKPADETPLEGEQESRAAGREAAKYRRQLRETEAERDTLLSQLAEARSATLDVVLDQEVAIPSDYGSHDRYVTLDKAADLFDLGYATREDCFNPDGTINHDVIRDAVTKMHAERPALFRRGGLHLPNEGKQPENRALQTSFTEAFKPPQNR